MTKTNFTPGERVRVFSYRRGSLTAKEKLEGEPGKILRSSGNFVDVELENGRTETGLFPFDVESLEHPVQTFRSIIRDLAAAPAISARFSIHHFCEEEAGFYVTAYPDGLLCPEIIITESGRVQFEEYMTGAELLAIGHAAAAAQKLYETHHGKAEA